MTKDEALKMVIENLQIQDFNAVNASIIAYCEEAIKQSSWKELSDDEIDSVWFEVVKENNFEGAGKYFARAIEAKLKVKNT
jgi:hypothetical protein